MKKVTRTILKWDFNKTDHNPCAQSPKDTIIRTPDGSPRILEITITLEGDTGRLELAMWHFYPWQPIYCEAVKKTLAQVPQLVLKNDYYEVNRYDLELTFKRISGEEFTTTAMKMVVALFTAMLSEHEFEFTWWPKVHQETFVNINGQLVGLGANLANQFYPENWVWRKMAMTAGQD